jgi:F-type H+-transporting ATPase subunit b
MLDAAPATGGTVAPAQPENPGFPPFKFETFPGQLFWLTITFAFLFVVLWRLAGPRIQGVIAERRNRINSDIQAAQALRKDAEGASAAYETALAGARARAQKLAEDNRKTIDDKINQAKAAADVDAQNSLTAAEAQIAKVREEARGHVLRAAQDAAIDIVSRLTGESVSASEAATAVQTATER